MREVNIVYLYEHAARELDVACAVSVLLEQKFGLSVEIVQWPVGFARIVHRLKPGMVVVLPFLYSESDYEPLTKYWRGIHYVNLTWEQLFYPGNEIAKSPRGDFATRRVFHHVWSNQYANTLRRLGVPDEKIFVNGQPAYTLYDEPYRLYFRSRENLAEKYGLDLAKKWFFFPENYNWAFYDKDRLDSFVRDGQTPEQVQEMKTYCEHSLKEVLDWFEKILQSDTGVEIILRPRPSITELEFDQIVGRLTGKLHEGMKIIQDGSVREWILASDVILSSHSTSLIEAAVAGKRSFILEPIPMPAALYVSWHNYLPHLRTFQDFFEVCTSGDVSCKYDKRLSAWAHETLMSNKDSIVNLAGYLNELVLTPNLDAKGSESFSRWNHLPSWMWALYRNLRRSYFYWRTGAVEPVYMKDVLANSEIEERKRKWNSILSIGG
jgi:surface carbohydrate biosynthesis protein